ncbi:MAG TPA: vitamin K epoxide reductase family protein [Streptosporangiaceae bacterium]|jgi:uncharacterized membrane protein
MASQKQARSAGQGTGSRNQKSQQRSGQQRGAAAARTTRRANGGAAKATQPAGGNAMAARAATPKARQNDKQQVADAAAAPQQPGAPGWLRWTTLGLSLAGLGLSIYLTVAHLVGTSILACSSNGLVNCSLVTTSSQSKLFGVFPVAELGLAFYVFMVAINSPWAWRMRQPAVYWLRLGSVVAGMVFVLYLVYVELIQLHHICLYCTYTHVVTFLLFGVLVFYAASRPPGEAAAGHAGRT